MKQLITTTLLISFSFLLSGCVTDAPAAPSQNGDLNKISKSNDKEKSGFLQKNLDNWLRNEWIPAVNKDKKIQKKYLKKSTVKGTNRNGSTKENYIEKEDKNFTLQEYVDKAAAYSKAHPTDEKDSNVKKLESMPVIGK